MEEVVLRIGAISGLSQDSPLSRIRRHPVRTKARSHIGHWVIPGDLVSLADMLTPLEEQKGTWQTCTYIPSPG